MKAKSYYDKLSRVYDLLSPRRYYHKAREFAVESLKLIPGQTVFNVPCGTGQNFAYFQAHLNNTGLIIGVDLSTGMLAKAQKKLIQQQWHNIKLVPANVLEINPQWVNERLEGRQIDAVLCDLGLSGFPKWQKVIDNLLAILNPGGKIVIMDWYLEQPSWRGELVKWIGKGEVNRPVWQYLEPKVRDFQLNNTFNRGGVFVASGTKI